MRRLPVFVRRLSLFASLGIAALILVVAASTTYAVNPAKLLPPGLQPAETDLSTDAGLTDEVFGESQVAVNPTNPDNIVYASLTHLFTVECEATGGPGCTQVNRTIVDGPVSLPIGPGPSGFFSVPGFAHNTLFVSHNKGNSWQAVVLPGFPPDHPEMDNQGDPSIAVGPDGTFCAVWDSINWGDDPNNALPNGGVSAASSTDGGLTWSTPVLTLTAMDGPKVTADPVTGRFYAHSSGAIGTRTATGDPSDPLFFNVPTPSDRYVAASSDCGATWTPPQRFGAGTVNAAGSLTAAHGVIATVARFTQEVQCETLLGADPATQAPCVVFSTSGDDGQTWTRQVVNAPDLTPPAGLPPGGGGILVAADPTTAGHFSIAGFRPAGGFAVYQTTDGGATWTGPAVVTDPHPFAETRAAMAYSLDGSLGLGWRAYVAASTGGQINAPFRIYAAVSDDGGATFTNALQIGGPSPKPPGAGFHNNADHYSGIAFGEDRLYFSWADSRNPDRSAFLGEAKVDAFFHPANQ